MRIPFKKVDKTTPVALIAFSSQPPIQTSMQHIHRQTFRVRSLLHFPMPILGFLLLLTTTACGPSAPALDEAQWSGELETWRSGRLERLLGERGWATITGLDWLDPGANLVGSARGSRVQFDSASAAPEVGTLYLTDGATRFVASPGAEVFQDDEPVSEIEMLADFTGNQTILKTGTVHFAVLRRGDRYGVRTWDSRAPILEQFGEIPIYTPDPSWMLPATFHRYTPSKTIEVSTVLGIPETNPSDGYLEFRYGGEAFRLDVIGTRADTSLFVIVGDLTNQTETYGAGRYLYVDRKDTSATTSPVWIDFNRLYNPPCAFTAYSTCAFPPEQNKLPFPITAGEKRYPGVK